jgi:tetratricopeptide (TPR) repeat protein
MRGLFALAAATIALPEPMRAQTGEELIALGDRERTALNATGALNYYESAIRAEPHNAEALWRAANAATDLGEFDDRRRDSLYRLAEDYGRRAVQANSRLAMAHFALAKALGRRALSVGARDRVKYAEVVRAEAIEALRLDSLNAGAHHVLGMWHAEIMRLSGIERFFARKVLGGKTIAEAKWEEATRLLERAAALEPDKIVHRLALADVYSDRGLKKQARTTYEEALGLKPIEYNDLRYRREVEVRLSSLR